MWWSSLSHYWKIGLLFGDWKQEGNVMKKYNIAISGLERFLPLQEGKNGWMKNGCYVMPQPVPVLSTAKQNYLWAGGLAGEGEIPAPMHLSESFYGVMLSADISTIKSWRNSNVTLLLIGFRC